MRDCTIISRLMEQIIYKYMQTETIQRNYGTNIMITQVEIHTIEAIGNCNGISITELAENRHKTKGAVSQLIYRLVKKGLVKKTVSKISDAQVSLYLTPLGEQAYEGHRKLHQQLNDEIFVALREMPDSTYNDLFVVLKKFERFLDKQIAENK